jgi:hypothetical protein
MTRYSNLETLRPTTQPEDKTMNRKLRNAVLAALAVIPCAVRSAPEAPPPAAAEAQVFATPDAAAQALLQAARSGGGAAVAALFGADGAELLSSGDEVEDKNNREAFVAKAAEKLATEPEGEDKATLYAGNDHWPFPVPLVKTAAGWRFDAAQGKVEIVNRRVGRNELHTLSVIHGYVEAQFDYANADHDGDGVAEYAQKLSSTPGQHDGLFWEEEPGQRSSPLGPLVAEARAEGYAVKGGSEPPVPYHGYYYRILTGQGADAPGGKYGYVINGNMIAGFGLVAFPAEYGSSGIMTFMVNHQGRIYQKDLGPKTAELAKAIKEYSPGTGWEPVETGE